LVSEDGVLVFKTLSFKNGLDGILEELVVSAVVGINWVDKKTGEGDLIDALAGVLGIHRKGNEGVSRSHLTASLSWDLETWSVVGHEDRSLDVLSGRKVGLEHELVEEGTVSIGDSLRLVVKGADHKQHLDESHDTHTLTASSSVELFAEVKSTTMLMTKVGLK